MFAEDMTASTNSQLWSDDLGAYGFALDDQKNRSMLSAAFPIRASIANATQAGLSLQSLSDPFFRIDIKIQHRYQTIRKLNCHQTSKVRHGGVGTIAELANFRHFDLD